MQHNVVAPKTMLKIIGDTFRIYREILPSILPLSILIVLISHLLTLFNPHTYITVNNLGVLIGTALIQFLAYMGVFLFLHGLLFIRIFSLMTKNQQTFRAATYDMLTKWSKLFALMSILVSLSLIAMLAPTLLLLPLSPIVAKISLPLTLIITILIFVFAVFSVPAIVLENKGVFSSIRMSVQLVRGNYWRTFFLTLLLPSFIVIFYFGLEYFLRGYLSSELTFLIFIAYNSLAWAWGSLFVIVLMRDLQVRHSK